MFDGLPGKAYEVVYADPPWGYYGSPRKWGAAAKFYDTLDDEAILAFPMRALMADRSVLFLWATSPRLDFAIGCLRAWGLFYRGVAFVWIKTRRDGTPIGAQGVRPSIVKPTAEYVLAASPVEKGRPLRLSDEGIANAVLAPRTQHSAKPEEVRARIEAMYPGASKLEVFARGRREGWDAWGEEADAGPRRLPRGHGSRDARTIGAALGAEAAARQADGGVATGSPADPDEPAAGPRVTPS